MSNWYKEFIWRYLIVGKEGRYQVILKRVELPIVQHNTCQDIMRTTRLGKFFVLDRSFICAGGEQGKDTCKVNYLLWNFFKPWRFYKIHVLFLYNN